jgi:hypothetical protein
MEISYGLMIELFNTENPDYAMYKWVEGDLSLIYTDVFEDEKIGFL